ncbi:glycosyltransferase [Nocardioides speluncae]|uniref:glycosyltransferase n=1 Tax=Nocardioides speluncae TaxID=2670337 RepID=UPI000D69ADA2|nr:glycosyltransferase [Nocardioides speluncae]
MSLIDIVAPPMRGHLHPALGIGRALAEEHDVRVFSTAGAQADIAAAGLTGIAILDGGDARIDAITSPEEPINGNPRKLIEEFRASLAIQADFQRELRAAWQSRRPDLVIADYVIPSVGPAAQALGIPWWTGHSSPCVIEGRLGPPAYVGGWSPGEGTLGRLRDAAARRGVRAFKRTAFLVARRRLRELGFTAPYRADGSEAAYSPDVILAQMPAGFEFERSVPESVVWVGPLLYTPPTDAPQPPFVEGRRHVLVTAGTHLAWHKLQLVAAAEATARRLPDLEVHVSLGRTDAAPVASELPNLAVLPYVSYARDLARYDLVAHHGGSGVLNQTLAAGLPSVVTPVDYDQFDHAARMEAAGLAVRADRLDNLPTAIEEALGRPELAAAAQVYADRIAAAPAAETIATLVRGRLAVASR